MRAQTKVAVVVIQVLNELAALQRKAEWKIKRARPERGWTYWLRSRLYSKLLQDEPPWPRDIEIPEISDEEWEKIMEDVPPPRPRPTMNW
jgi:hypothetical protein